MLLDGMLVSNCSWSNVSSFRDIWSRCHKINISMVIDNVVLVRVGADCGKNPVFSIDMLG